VIHDDNQETFRLPCSIHSYSNNGAFHQQTGSYKWVMQLVFVSTRYQFHFSVHCE
jgi:hypothetical protein